MDIQRINKLMVMIIKVASTKSCMATRSGILELGHAELHYKISDRSMNIQLYIKSSLCTI